jgi:hypothetical protein
LTNDYRNLLPHLVEYPFPLRAGGNVYFWLPRDLSLAEVERLAACLETLVDVTKTSEPYPVGERPTQAELTAACQGPEDAKAWVVKAREILEGYRQSHDLACRGGVCECDHCEAARGLLRGR